MTEFEVLDRRGTRERGGFRHRADVTHVREYFWAGLIGRGDILDYTAELVQILDDSSNFVLNSFQPLLADADPTPLWELDRQTILGELDTDLPQQWIYLATSHYLSEAALQMRAVSALIHMEVVHYSLPALVRAIVERVGVVCWILDAPGSWELRFRRAGLTGAVSNFRYANLYRGSDPSAYERLKNQRREIRDLLERRFAVQSGPGVETTYIGDPDAWKVCGDIYPTFRNLAVEAFKSPDIDPSMAKYVYDFLAVHSHPTIHAGLKFVEVLASGSQYKVDYDDVDRVTRFALVALLNGVRCWDGYFQENPPLRISARESIFDRFDLLSKSIQDSSE